MDITKKIKHLLVDENISISELAKRLETSQQNLNNKLKRNNFSVKEMQEIAKALNYDLIIEFTKRE